MPLPPLPPDRVVRFGFLLCVVGLVIACLGLLPSFTTAKAFPWPVFAGSAVYVPGAILAFLNSKGRERNSTFMWLRVIRFGFFAVLAISLFRMANG